MVSFLHFSHLFGQEVDFRQTGRASYYADYLQGRRTASGERYSHKKYTAAHLTLPLGTVIKVTNLLNGKAVIVKVNDRGPHTDKYCIDLSKAAARVLRIIGDAENEILIETKLDVADQPILQDTSIASQAIDSVWFEEKLMTTNQLFDLTAKAVAPEGYGFKLYNYKELNYTLYLARKIGRYIAGDSVYIEPIITSKGIKEYTLWVGNFPNPKTASKLKKQLLRFGIRKPVLKKYP
jgi:rare lipoprotein A